MRLLKIGIYYSKYLEQFYARSPNLADQPYSVQHHALIDDCFGSSDFWTRALVELGYDTCDLISNAEPLQKMWARERGVVFDSSSWLFQITAAQVKEFQPEVLLVADYSTITAAFLRHLKETCGSIKLILVWCGAPFADDSIFHECDIVLSCVPELVKTFEENGHQSRHVNHAFEPRLLNKIDVQSEANVDFSFIGSIFKATHFHMDRERILSTLVRNTNLQIWSDVPAPAEQSPLDAAVPRVRLPFWKLGSRWRSTQTAEPVSTSSEIDQLILRRSKPALFGLDMFQQLHDSRVALNTHIDISPTNASNMRLFEATGVGSCLLTDSKANLATLFELNSEVVAYANVNECIEKVRYLLTNEKERRSIAAAGQRRTLRDHTFGNRAARIDSIVREALA